MAKLKQSKRSKAKYPALKRDLNLKTRTDLIDYDYVNNLPEKWTDPITGKEYKPKQFLNDFTEEYINANFLNKKRIHKKKKIAHPGNPELIRLKERINKNIKNLSRLISSFNVSIKSKASLKKLLQAFKKSVTKCIAHELKSIDDFYKKESEDRNNARNRCIFTREKAKGNLEYIDINKGKSDNGKVESKPKVLPVKIYTKEEIAELEKKLNLSKETKNS